MRWSGLRNNFKYIIIIVLLEPRVTRIQNLFDEELQIKKRLWVVSGRVYSKSVKYIYIYIVEEDELFHFFCVWGFGNWWWEDDDEEEEAFINA